MKNNNVIFKNRLDNSVMTLKEVKEGYEDLKDILDGVTFDDYIKDITDKNNGYCDIVEE